MTAIAPRTWKSAQRVCAAPARRHANSDADASQRTASRWHSERSERSRQGEGSQRHTDTRSRGRGRQGHPEEGVAGRPQEGRPPEQRPRVGEERPRQPCGARRRGLRVAGDVGPADSRCRHEKYFTIQSQRQAQDRGQPLGLDGTGSAAQGQPRGRRPGTPTQGQTPGPHSGPKLRGPTRQSAPLSRPQCCGMRQKKGR